MFEYVKNLPFDDMLSFLFNFFGGEVWLIALLMTVLTLIFNYIAGKLKKSRRVGGTPPTGNRP
jgi:hypothetical protein